MSDSTATASNALDKAIAAWNLRLGAAFPDLSRTLARAREDLSGLQELLAHHQTLRTAILLPEGEDAKANPKAAETIHRLLESLADFHVEMETLRAQIRRTTETAQHLGKNLKELTGQERDVLETSTPESAPDGQSPEAVALAQAQRLVAELREESTRLKAQPESPTARTPVPDEAQNEIVALRMEVNELREAASENAITLHLDHDLQQLIREQAFDDSGKRRPMGRILVNAGIINESQLEAALREQRSAWNRHLGAILVELGYADEERIAQAIAAQTRLPFVYLDDERAETHAVQLINGKLAHHHSSLPLRVQGRELIVAMANPLDLVALEDLKIASRLDIEPVVASAKEIRAKLRHYYGA